MVELLLVEVASPQPWRGSVDDVADAVRFIYLQVDVATRQLIVEWIGPGIEVEMLQGDAQSVLPGQADVEPVARPIVVPHILVDVCSHRYLNS